MAQSCYYSDCSGHTSLGKKADTGEETQMMSGLNKSEFNGDGKSLTFTLCEHLENQWDLSCDFFQGQGETDKMILTGCVGKQ